MKESEIDELARKDKDEPIENDVPDDEPDAASKKQALALAENIVTAGDEANLHPTEIMPALWALTVYKGVRGFSFVPLDAESFEIYLHGSKKRISPKDGEYDLGVNNLEDDFKNGVLDANKYIQQGKFIPEVKKIDLMGGKTTKLGDEFTNIDISAEKGILGSASDMDKFIKPNSIDEIVCNNPYIPLVKDPFELFINNAKTVLKKDRILAITGQPQNGLIGKLTVEKLEQAGFEVLEFKIPLAENFKNLTFHTTGGNPINPNTMVSIKLKKK